MPALFSMLWLGHFARYYAGIMCLTVLCEIRTMNERFTHVHGYCCRDQASSNVGKNLIYQDGKFFRATAPNMSMDDKWQLSIYTFCWGSKYTHVSFSAKKKTVKAVFSMNQITSSYIHRVKIPFFKWTSHISWIKEGSRRREKTLGVVKNVVQGEGRLFLSKK